MTETITRKTQEPFVQLARDLTGPFDFSLDRERKAQDFSMETSFIHFGQNGKRLGAESYLLKLRYVPMAENVDQYRCLELQLQINDSPPLNIPELSNWKYVFNPMLSGADERGPLWGISQEKFAKLKDGAGKDLPFNLRYALYNNFIDFHSINDVFARPMKFGTGIQDLRKIGQRITHPASFISASIKFGSEIKAGSTFQNGEVTLELKGVSIVDGSPCAIVAYDAGESNLKMIIPFSGEEDSVSLAGSHYKVDMYIDLANRWLRKATLDEHVITEISIPGSMSKLNEYTVRHIKLRLSG
jgi:hypothetical protein